MTMRERLEMKAAEAWANAPEWPYRDVVDAILREMIPMAKEMQSVYDAALCCLPAGYEVDDEVIAWEAMLQHILDEGRGDKENAA